MTHSPAHILKTYLQAQGFGTDPPSEGVWPTYVSSLPSTDGDPDDALALYDTAGVLDGRIMRTGESVIHHGLQLRVRSRSYATAYQKIQEITADLDAVSRALVTIGSNSYIVQSITRTTGVISLGESELRGRRSLVLNMIATLTAL